MTNPQTSVLCQRCHRYWPQDPMRHDYPDKHVCVGSENYRPLSGRPQMRVFRWLIAIVLVVVALLVLGTWNRYVAYQDQHCSNSDWANGPHPEWC
jgi:hypothetical protein